MTLYVPCANGKLYALSPDGTTNWVVRTGGHFLSSPAIAADGTIYVGSLSNFFNKLYAFSPAGTTNWVFSMGPVLLPSLMRPADTAFLTGYRVGRHDLYRVTGWPCLCHRGPTGATNWVAALGAATHSTPTEPSRGHCHVLLE